MQVSSFSDKLTEQLQNPTSELQQFFSKAFSLEQTQAGNERLKPQYEK